ncbi:MAG: ComF family protein [Minisyncoccia bacterium]|jgi:ComF family protein
MSFDFLVSLFFPRRCLACGKTLRAGALCPACRGKITTARTFFCGRCGSPLPGPKLHDPRRTCHPDFPYVLGAAGSYKDETLRALVHALKFRGVRAAAEPLASIMAEYALPFKTDLLRYVAMPIPLSRERFRIRGFNQSERIATRFAEYFGLPVATKCLVRIKHAKPQSETTSVAERRENIRGCFAVADAAAACGKNVLLVDDVSTSGATFLEAARALKDAHAADIIALAAAKA